MFQQKVNSCPGAVMVCSYKASNGLSYQQCFYVQIPNTILCWDIFASNLATHHCNVGTTLGKTDPDCPALRAAREPRLSSRNAKGIHVRRQLVLPGRVSTQPAHQDLSFLWEIKMTVRSRYEGIPFFHLVRFDVYALCYNISNFVHLATKSDINFLDTRNHEIMN